MSITSTEGQMGGEREKPANPLPMALDYRAMLREKEEAFRQHHAADFVLTAGATAVNFACGYLYWLQRIVNQSITSPPDWSKVASLYLLNRAMDDIHSVMELAERGAIMQAMSTLSSTFEVELALLEIGNDVKKGELWLTKEGTTGEVFSKRENKHGNPIEQRLKERGRDFYTSFDLPGLTDKELRAYHERRYEELYGALCSYKHVQPDVQRRFGTKRTEKGTEVQPGPEWSEHSRLSTLAVYDFAEDLAENIFMVVVKAHLKQPYEGQAVRFLKQMQSAWQKVEEMREAQMEESGEGEAHAPAPASPSPTLPDLQT